MDSKGAGVNDSPVGCQSRAPASSQDGESTLPSKRHRVSFFFFDGFDAAGVNDSPVGCQSRAPADPQIGESTFPSNGHRVSFFFFDGFEAAGVNDSPAQPCSQFLQTSTHAADCETTSSSAGVSSMVLLLLPQAGKTVSKRFRDTSR